MSYPKEGEFRSEYTRSQAQILNGGMKYDQGLDSLKPDDKDMLKIFELGLRMHSARLGLPRFALWISDLVELSDRHGLSGDLNRKVNPPFTKEELKRSTAAMQSDFNN